jgi:membrane protease YdiL (CAAX protease family)
MFTGLSILAEIVPQSGLFWDYSQPPSGAVLAGLFFLLLLCAGIVLDLTLVVYFIKRPARPKVWYEDLASRAMPGRLVLILLLTIIALYTACSLSYGALFPGVYELGPDTLLFMALFFHVPALVILAGVFMYRRRSGREQLGLSLRRAPAMIGLSLLLYLAAIPILWFYSMLYQVFLYQLGFDFYLQDVAQVFLAPAPVWKRIIMYFIAIIVAPVFEEIVFRGILLPWVVRRTGLWTGIAIVSLLFAGMHFHLPSLLPLFLLSAMFCAAYGRTRSLFVPIGMHACFNAVTVILLALTGG